MGSSSSKLTYENGKPSFGEITHVHPMFNGLLFRLSDRKHNRWAFYNDSIEYIIHVSILFDYDSQVVPLGLATAYRVDDPEVGKEDDVGKYVVEVDVAPLATELFVEGRVTGWTVDALEARTAANEQEFRL
ncbi:putative calpain-like cysteine peptidase [Trypanosoma cruzi]|uniref:Putative calpain-like cysteine peptidase n=1 Tax=Trypanosoma cruzi TaxID=5693 RepID=A0A2V2W9Q2_TRYCR|nr:putative calpain-like cysteine peptidase [Trypanosoma cruzi]PWV05366.1 putative calpain-like cysteine peptidase [Trypanosoma cruzi]RNC50444.1 putative calpain-like protein [Trypanosoma cruzi]